MRTAVVSALMIVAIVLLSSLGCGQKQDEPQTKAESGTAPERKQPSKAPRDTEVPAAEPEVSSPAASTEAPVRFGHVLVTWNSGKQGEAVVKFLQVDWQDPAVFQGIPILIMSEQQFAALSQEQRDAISPQTEALSKAIRDLAREVVAAGEKLAAAGATDGAKAYFKAVQQFGQALAAPERMLIIQLVGKAIAEFAQDKLSAVR